MKRGRGVLGQGLCGLAACLLVSCAGTPLPGALEEPGKWTGSPVVTTRFGVVQAGEAADGTWLWKAIPYARPPVDDLRWRAPQDPVPWSGVRSPTSFGAACTQFSPVSLGGVLGSEDCLSLNVWRPRDRETGLPVYVWIHGGGNSIGSATMVADYYGNRVAARSRMVFVSMNYRLGPFGWFTHPALREGASPEDASGNYGTLDIIQALKWIRQNIGAFGGDPGNVTVTGESAGAFNVLSLLIAPPAAGLFQRALAESGSATTRGMDEADAKAAETLEKLLVGAGRARTVAAARELAATMTAEEIASFLRSRTDRQIMKSYSSVAMGMIDNPALLRDGAVLPREGFDALSTGSYPNKVPVLIGSNKEELKLFLAFAGSPSWRSALYAEVVKYGSDRWKASGVDEVARRLAGHPDQPPVYAYLFTWGAPDAQGQSPLPGTWGRRLGAFHSLEIPFFLGTDTVDGFLQGLIFTKKNEPGRKALSAVMMDYAAQFARTGNPNRPGSGLPTWVPWTNGVGLPKLIVLDAIGAEAAISMSDVELTDESVMASLGNDLAEPLRSQTLSFLGKSHMPAGVR